MAVRVPDNADGLWRSYHGSRTYHRYRQYELNAAWCHQTALCGRETRAGNSAYSLLRPKPSGLICRKCEKLLAALGDKA